jgi:hypothetical protein
MGRQSKNRIKCDGLRLASCELVMQRPHMLNEVETARLRRYLFRETA